MNGLRQTVVTTHWFASRLKQLWEQQARRLLSSLLRVNLQVRDGFTRHSTGRH
jgi:hypothetical protein